MAALPFQHTPTNCSTRTVATGPSLRDDWCPRVASSSALHYKVLITFSSSASVRSRGECLEKPRADVGEHSNMNKNRLRRHVWNWMVAKL